jgi:hypothetical protein
VNIRKNALNRSERISVRTALQELCPATSRLGAKKRLLQELNTVQMSPGKKDLNHFPLQFQYSFKIAAE